MNQFFVNELEIGMLLWKKLYVLAVSSKLLIFSKQVQEPSQKNLWQH